MDLKRLPGLALLLCSCARQEMPDPRDAARQYEEAVRRGDAARVHALLERDARAAHSVDDVRSLLEQGGPELRRAAAACADPEADLRATATLRGPRDGEASLRLEEGVFRIDSDTALFPRPRTPEAAARALAWALQSGQVHRVEGTLSAERRAGLEERRVALLESLSALDRATIQVLDHRAVIELPDGQLIELVLEGGVWRVEAVP